MSQFIPKFDYPSSLNEYAVSASKYLEQHKEYDVLCTGVAVFNTEGKLLLVQRAADEKAFPNAWVGVVGFQCKLGSRDLGVKLCLTCFNADRS
jgi:8-oxo-dGTP pyrophosphatase MutT (NUDIX family)